MDREKLIEKRIFVLQYLIHIYGGIICKIHSIHYDPSPKLHVGFCRLSRLIEYTEGMCKLLGSANEGT